MEKLTRVKPLLEKAGITTAYQLGKALGVKPQTAQKWYDRDLSEQGTIMVADLLGISIDYIYGRVENPYMTNDTQNAQDTKVSA